MTTQPGSLARRVQTLFGLWFFTCSLAAAAAPVKFDIPAQPAPSALQAFIKQSGHEVLFPFDELKDIQGSAVRGEFEAADALHRLLSGTRYTATLQGARRFVVVLAGTQSDGTGAIGGIVVTEESRRPIVGAVVELQGADLQAATDAKGGFLFEKLAAGRYAIVIEAPGRQRTVVTDIVLRPGQRRTLRTTAIPALSAGVIELDPFRVSAERMDGIVELEPYEVAGRRTKPFTTGNLDISRTIDDVQPYFIFDSETIAQAGVVSLEDFLKQRLTMNTVAQTHSQVTGFNAHGNTSAINLRGLGTDKTLVLVNGRRMPGISLTNNVVPANSQSDINGIPLSAIERIEVLPSSASGIYGGSAIGGVVNIVLKSDYHGGEVTATYETPEDTHAPIRSVSVSYGLSLENGRTHVALSASWKDTEPMLWQDRQDIYQRNFDRILANSPTFVGSTTSPDLGSLPNILPNSNSATTPATLPLKNGLGTVPSRLTHIPAGTSPTTPWSMLAAGLIANAGRFNLDPPPTAQFPNGRFRRVGTPSETRSFRATVRRQMFPRLELMADFMWADNQTSALYVPLESHVTVPQASPANPFAAAVRVRIPDSTHYPLDSRSLTRRATGSAFVKLPWDWIAALDLSHSENQFDIQRYSEDSAARNADLASGVLNPFVDTVLHPLNMQKYLFPIVHSSGSQMTDLALRGSGALPALPWGQPRLTLGIERRLQVVPERTEVRDFPITVASSFLRHFFEFETLTDSVYVEAKVPLVREAKFRGLHAIEVQISGRMESYETDTGTLYSEYFFERTPPVLQYSNATGAGTSAANAFIRGSDKYDSRNSTVGLKFQPVKELTFRASRATAMLPTTPNQLIRNADIDPFPSIVNDPVTGAVGINVNTISGGNPSVRPQHSESLNLGMIWAPESSRLKGLRVNAEYYRTRQADRISYGGAQQMINSYPERVTRDGAGNITLVDLSAINLGNEDTSGWDLSATYTWKTGIGLFDVHAVCTIIDRLKSEVPGSAGLVWVDAAGNHPFEGGAPKRKASFSLGWHKGNWHAGWSGRYVAGYKVEQAPGSMVHVVFPDFAAFFTRYTDAQGGYTIPSQNYHDVFVGYDFRDRGGVEARSRPAALRTRVLNSVSIQVGVRNALDAVPPMDVSYSPGNFYLSPFGDNRLRSWWVSVKKTF